MVMVVGGGGGAQEDDVPAKLEQAIVLCRGVTCNLLASPTMLYISTCNSHLGRGSSRYLLLILRVIKPGSPEVRAVSLWKTITAQATCNYQLHSTRPELSLSTTLTPKAHAFRRLSTISRGTVDRGN